MQHSQPWEAEDNTVVWVAYDGEVLGIIAIAGTDRPTAARAIAQLKRLGVEQIVMLTGDNARTAHTKSELHNPDSEQAACVGANGVCPA